MLLRALVELLQILVYKSICMVVCCYESVSYLINTLWITCFKSIVAFLFIILLHRLLHHLFKHHFNRPQIQTPCIIRYHGWNLRMSNLWLCNILSDWLVIFRFIRGISLAYFINQFLMQIFLIHFIFDL